MCSIGIEPGPTREMVDDWNGPHPNGRPDARQNPATGWHVIGWRGHLPLIQTGRCGDLSFCTRATWGDSKLSVAVSNPPKNHPFSSNA